MMGAKEDIKFRNKIQELHHFYQKRMSQVIWRIASAFLFASMLGWLLLFLTW